MGILIDIAYLCALILVSPILVTKMIRHGRYRRGFRQRFGKIPKRYGLQPVIWIHAVSLGEINAIRTLVEELHSQLPDFRVVISSTTDTGMDAAKRLFAPAHEVFQWPLDFSWVVARALNRMSPSLVVLMEGEVWPNFLAACNKRNIPTVVVNGRMSPNKGYPRYKMLGPLAGNLFNRLTAIGVQDEIYAEKFIELGTKPEKIHLTGMMKFDTIQVTDHITGQDELAAAVGLGAEDQQIFVTGGTGPGEELIVLDTYKSLLENHPNLRLVIVPRKPERFDEVARLISSSGFECIRRSEHPNGQKCKLSENTVVLGDTMGELKAFYALADVVFVGRSLVPMGGSDMIEAAGLGKSTCFGPYTFNFPQAEKLKTHGCVEVTDGAELVLQISIWLNDPQAAKLAGDKVQQYVRLQQGATRRNVELIAHLLKRVPATKPGNIATDKIAE